MSKKNWIDSMARLGLSAKGVVYCLIGLLVLFAVIKGRSSSAKEADKGGVFQFIQDLPAGKILLGIVVLGLVCYTAWRFIQAFKKDNGEDSGIGKRLRYISSGLVYGAFSFYGVKLLIGEQSGGQSNNKEAAQQVLDLPAGQWLLGLAALALAGIGFYQIWYALSEKYKKHVSGLSLHEHTNRLLLSSGKAGYIARGVVWLILSFLLSKAALNANSQEAGSTGDAFKFLGAASYGPYLLAALALGLICYGIFNFIRARFESFH
jgi:hypothetical protein